MAFDFRPLALFFLAATLMFLWVALITKDDRDGRRLMFCFSFLEFSVAFGHIFGGVAAEDISLAGSTLGAVAIAFIFFIRRRRIGRGSPSEN